MNADVSSVASSADAPRENSEDMPLREKPPVALVLGGATGMLGQALTRAAAAKGWDVHTLGREDGPVTDPAFLEDALSRMNPDYIFNGIAYTAVDLAESEKERACALNRAFPALLGGMTLSLIHISMSGCSVLSALQVKGTAQMPPYWRAFSGTSLPSALRTFSGISRKTDIVNTPF